MKWTHPPQPSLAFGFRLGFGALGLTLALGAWGCGSDAAREETTPAATSAAESDAAPAAAQETAAAPPAGSLDAGASSAAPPDPALAGLPPVKAQPRGQSADAHLTLTGSYEVNGKAASNCALFPNKTFQIGLNVPGAPFFVLRLENFHGAGEYDGDGRVRANFSGETVRQSRGVTKTTITVVPSNEPGGRESISGTFSGTYKGEGGQGTVSGTFERCLYELPKFNQ